MLDPVERSRLRERLRQIVDQHYNGRISTFGRACGVGFSVARRLLESDTMPYEKTLRRVEEALGTTLEALVDPSEAPIVSPRRVRMWAHYNTPPPLRRKAGV